MDTIAFGNRVRAARELLGITQEDLASRVGMSPSHMSIVERGVKVPRMDTVVKLANELDVSADYLLQDSISFCPALWNSLKENGIACCTRQTTARNNPS